MRNVLICSAAFVTLLAVDANASFIAADWATNNAILYDNAFNQTGSFATGLTNPNGAAGDASRIYIGSFNQTAIRVYDYAGSVLDTFVNPNFSNLQGLEVVGSELAVAYTPTDDSVINFYDKTTGAFTRSISNAAISSTVEGLAYDGSLLWALGDTLLGIDPTTGALVSNIPNAASGEAFGGTALAYAGPGQLAIGAQSGNWYIVSTTDGSVISSGNAPRVEFFGLGTLQDTAAVPEPGTMTLFGTGALVAWYRRRQNAKSNT